MYPLIVAVTKMVQPKACNLEHCTKENPFATKEVKMMNNSEKRFVLYYWSAMNIYKVHGKYSRINLPECIKKAVRSTYPEDSPENI